MIGCQQPYPTAPLSAATPPAPLPHPRMEDVARAAGVSLVTVSRAVNQPDKLSPKTLARVRAAVEALGFVPNLTAGSLASNRSRIVATVVPTIANLVFSETVDALSRTLATGGYQLLLGQSGYRTGDELALIDAFLGRRVDGLVLTGSVPSPQLRAKLRRARIPVVQTWDLGGPALDMQVGFSNTAAGAAAANHLLQRGYRHLAFLGAEEERSRQRLTGFRAAAAAQGLTDIPAELILPPAQVDDVGARFADLLQRRPDTDAVFCNNDLLATGVLFECQRRGWAVPERMAVLGFGDLAIGRSTWPRLSTVRVRHAQMGERAGQLLLTRLAGQVPESPVVDVGFEIIPRDST